MTVIRRATSVDAAVLDEMVRELAAHEGSLDHVRVDARGWSELLQRPEVVVTHHEEALEWLARLKVAVPDEVGFVHLNLPDTSGAMKVPQLASASQPANAPSAAAQQAATKSGFTIKGDRDAVFASVGEALADIPGLTIASRAQLLGSYDVSYEGSSFLVRVVATEAGSYVSAVDPRGLPAVAEAPVKLIATLKSKLGG